MYLTAKELPFQKKYPLDMMPTMDSANLLPLPKYDVEEKADDGEDDA